MYNLSDEVTRKFIDVIPISDLEIETESGWVDITHLNKTIEYEKWILETESGIILECADNHIVFRGNSEEVFVKDLIPGDIIKGEYGHEVIKSIHNSELLENMYDLSVTGNHTYFANGLLHHNTTVSAAYFIWYIIFNSRKSVAILANKQATADEIMDRIRLGYENLPKWMQQGVKTWNKRTIELENGSKCFGAATSKTGTRGKSVNVLYLDEFAWVENAQANDFFTSVYPTITAGKDSKVFMTSTPNGFNHFHKFWSDAEKGINGFYPLRVHWYETPGRDQEWFNNQEKVLGELKTAQELLAEFLGSSFQLLSAAALSRLTYELPLKEYEGQYKGLRIYSIPKKGRSYVMTVDVSRGRHLDDSAFWVVDVTEQPYRLAATFNNNEIPPLMYATLLHRIAKNYNDAYTLVEINDVGSQVAESLFYDFEYDSMFWTKSGNQVGKKGADPYPGIRTTKATKRIGCANLKDMIERNNLLVQDHITISQLSTFVQSKSGSYEADEGFKDDLVMCGVLFSWLAAQPWFKDLTDQDMRLKMYSGIMEEIESDILPTFIYSDGQEEYSDVDREALALLC